MKFPHIQQHDSSDCGAACIASICAHYGRETTIVKLRELLGTDISGTTIKGITGALVKLGFEAKAVRVDKEAFTSKFTLPAVAHIVKEDGTSHYVVIFSANVNSGTIKYMDPAEDKHQKASVDEFFENFDGILVMMVPNENFVKSKEGAKSVLSSFIGLLKPHKRLFAVAIATTVILTIIGIVLSIFNKILIDEIIPYNLNDQLRIFAIVLAVVVVVQVILGALRQHVMLYLSLKIDIPLTLGYFEHVFRLPMNFFASRKTGDIVTRFQDAGVIAGVLTGVALTVFIDVSMAVIVGIVLFTMNANLFGIIIILAIVSAVLIFLFRAPYRKLNKKQMEQHARLNSEVIESLNGIETVKTNTSEELMMERIETEYIKTLKLGFRGGVLSNIQGSLSSLTGGLGNIGILVMGGFFVISGETTLGTLVAFMSLSGFFIGPINRLVSLQLSIQEANISLKRLSEIYSVDEEEDEELEKDSMILGEKIDNIEIEGISFRYGSKPLTLSNISVVIPRGKKVAIVGRSGSGKTTLSKLMLKFYIPESGRITFNGIDLKNINPFSIRERIGCVPQNVQLFSGSIMSNMLIGKSDATPNEISSACALAGCDEFINKLPAGYNTRLDENGGGLSGGEKQRLALARVLVKKPDFIILDEATSNMDFLTEQQIYDTLFNKMKETTMMIIAHRLSTIRKCDVIYVMDGGKITESGTHEELLKRGGLYLKLWESQVGELPGVNPSTSEKEQQTRQEKKIEGDNDIEYQ
ncbi:MAG: peptidase domain-containing ABC transporter [Methanomassiliicoccaceae archaeon]|nr:peptidase domain-containing ABC transporter [Methanomassiliicoccaceae archaeon]